MIRLAPPILCLALAASVPSPGAAAEAPGGKSPYERLLSSLPPLKDLPKDKPYTLRVQYLEDELLPTLDDLALKSLYRKTEALLKDWYGYRVRIVHAGRKPLTDFIQDYYPHLRQPLYAEPLRGYIDVDAADGRERLLETVRRDFEGRSLDLIGSYIDLGTARDTDEAVEAAARHFLRKLEKIRSVPLAGGRTLKDRIVAFPPWVVFLMELKEADFLLTNSIVAGADSEMPIYVIARGGVTTGMVSNNRRNAYQGAGIVGLYPILSDAPAFVEERGPAPRKEVLDSAATFWMHELGHLFLRYAEHYGHPHCVHVAPKGLDYFRWHREIRKGGPCRLEHKKLTLF